MKKLQDFLKEKGEADEFESLKRASDRDLVVKPSKYISNSTKLGWLIGLLDDIYEVKELEDGSAYLVKKNENN